jgi:hypothetical protein
LAAFAAFWGIVYFTGSGTFCLFKTFTGIPCPGCGLTRSFVSLCHLDFYSSFFHHPLLLLVLFSMGIAFVARFGPPDRFSFIRRLSRSNAYWSVVLGLIVVVYIVRMALFFPHTPPMDFGKKSYYQRIITSF